LHQRALKEGVNFRIEDVRKEIQQALLVNHAKIDNLSHHEIRRTLEQRLVREYRHYIEYAPNSIEQKIKIEIYDYFVSQGNAYTYLNLTTPLKTNKNPKDVEKVVQNLDVFNTNIRQYIAYLEKLLSNDKVSISPRTFVDIRKDITAIVKSLLAVNTLIRFENSNTFLSTIIKLQDQISSLLLLHKNESFSFSAIQKKLSEIHFSLESHIDVRDALDILKN
jgi:hypothetical protein